jgi:hypothetical protein
MKKTTINEIIKAYEMDSISHQKNAPTNNAMITMLENTNLEYLTVEPTRSGNIFNRGSVAECVIRSVINEYVLGHTSNHYKKSSNGSDLSTKKKSVDMLQDLGLASNKNYEIKLLSSLARASYDNANKSDFIIMLDIRAKSKGVYLVKYSDLVLYNGASIKDYKGQRLDLLCELLGL